MEMEKDNRSGSGTLEGQEETPASGARVLDDKVLVLLPSQALSEKTVENIARDFCRQSNKFLLATILPAPSGGAEIPHYRLLDDLHTYERYVFEMRKLFENNGFLKLTTVPVTIREPERELNFLIERHDIGWVIGFEDNRADLPKILQQGNLGPDSEKQPDVKIYSLE